jgi:hypothetical protein
MATTLVKNVGKPNPEADPLILTEGWEMAGTSDKKTKTTAVIFTDGTGQELHLCSCSC